MTYSEDVIKLNPKLRKEIATVPASKYHNARAEARGMRFQSGHEAAEISKLILLEEDKRIFSLRLQVKFVLPGGLFYIADAVYLEQSETGLQIVVFDAKGYETKEWKIKRKLFEEMYGIKIRIG